MSAVLLVALVFLVPWFHVAKPGGGHTSASGWTSLPTLRWLILVTAGLGVLLAYFQAARAAPALPVTTDVIAVTLGSVTTVVLLIRLLTGAGSPQAGAFAGLAAVAALTGAAFAALRQEDGWQPGPGHPVETIVIGQSGARDGRGSATNIG
ncbi:MAG: hypothetical protein ACJ780_11120 [Solirubrobacteraceae bacterium]